MTKEKVFTTIPYEILRREWLTQKIQNIDLRGIHFKRLSHIFKEMGCEEPEKKANKYLENYVIGRACELNRRTVAQIWINDNYYSGGINNLKDLIREVKDAYRKAELNSFIIVEIGYEKIENGHVIEEEWYRKIIIQKVKNND